MEGRGEREPSCRLGTMVLGEAKLRGLDCATEGNTQSILLIAFNGTKMRRKHFNNILMIYFDAMKIIK